THLAWDQQRLDQARVELDDPRDEQLHEEAVDRGFAAAQRLELLGPDGQRLGRLDGLDGCGAHHRRRVPDERELTEELARAQEPEDRGIAGEARATHHDAPGDDEMNRVRRIAGVEDDLTPIEAPAPGLREDQPSLVLSEVVEDREADRAGHGTNHDERARPELDQHRPPARVRRAGGHELELSGSPLALRRAGIAPYRDSYGAAAAGSIRASAPGRRAVVSAAPGLGAPGKMGGHREVAGGEVGPRRVRGRRRHARGSGPRRRWPGCEFAWERPPGCKGAGDRPGGLEPRKRQRPRKGGGGDDRSGPGRPDAPSRHRLRTRAPRATSPVVLTISPSGAVLPRARRR